MDRVFLSDETLDVDGLKASLVNGQRGAVVSFEGRVRETEGKMELRGIDYEAYAAMAEKQLDELLRQAHEKWPQFEAVVAHRRGVVAVGECAVFIAVATVHRAEAFAICHWLIDELKARVPIFKREHLPRGSGRQT
jgi:molybdopterin synthase catalytic subunit